MKINVRAVGKLKQSPEKELVDYYLKICKWKVAVTEIEIKGSSSVEQRKNREADDLLSDVDGAYVIALDERGDTPTSAEFSTMMKKCQDNARNVVFIIGGSDGLAQTVRDRADKLISFGRMTLPHMLARVVLCEQLYRAGTIVDGHPYSK